MVDELEREIASAARETSFSGAIRADRDGQTVARAFGFAHRGHRVPNSVHTRFGIASGTKGLTALTVVSLIEQGLLGWDTTARSVLGADLPLIDGRVTVEHLLAHRSGIGDYMDESPGHPITDYALTVPVHQLASTDGYLTVLGGLAAKFEPDTRFEYCNGGFVVLALIAERAAGEAFHDLVARRVCEPGGMRDTAFLRSDELPGGTAAGYLFEHGERTNVLHLPVRGSGDGGMYSTVADLRAFWTALFEGRIVSADAVARMVRPRSDPASGASRYGLGFWLAPSGPAVELEGYDAGVSFRSLHDPMSGTTLTVVANTSDGAWPVLRRLQPLLGFGEAAS